jgi:kynureninase
VDAAAWCSYKYINAGPGTIGGLFVHERHAQLDLRGRLAGWWGSSKDTRFAMNNHFVPIPGAKGFQLSNPSILDITALNASLEVFAMAGGMEMIREKSLKITAYLEKLLLRSLSYDKKLFEIITPVRPSERGAQLSLKLQGGLLDVVMHELEERGVVTDERKPDVVRVAPAPLYNSYEDCWAFVRAFGEALDIAVKTKEGELKAEGMDDLKMTT